jgi:branched-chain amino acid transport system substrate-binding protein
MPALVRTWTCMIGVLALAGCARKSPPEPILVGHVASPGSGENARRGIQLAVKEANEAENLIAGRRVMVLHPVVGGDSAALAHVAARLISVNKVAALLGATNAAEAEALGRAAQPSGVPVVTLTDLPRSRLGENVFAAELAPADRGQVLARFAAEELKADRVAAIVGPGDENADLAAAFTRQFTRDDAGRRADRWSLDREAGAGSLVEQVRHARPKGILIAGSSADLAELRSALQAAGLDLPLLFAGPARERTALAADRDAGSGVYLATLHPADGDVKRQQFPERYEKEFGAVPDAEARLAYDAARVLFGAMRRADGAHKDKLREELAKAFVVCLEEGRRKEAKAYSLEGK